MPSFSLMNIDPRRNADKEALDKVFGEGNWTPKASSGLPSVEATAEYPTCKDVVVALEDAGLTPPPEVTQL